MRRPPLLPTLVLSVLAACGGDSGPSQSGEVARMVSAGSDNACALDATGQVWCWGAGAVGQIGNGDLDDARVPEAVIGGLTGRLVSTGEYHACALTPASVAW